MVTGLNAFGQSTTQQGVGTGFIIDEAGYIVTNNHVVSGDDGQPADEIEITPSAGRTLDAAISGRAARTDVAARPARATAPGRVPWRPPASLRRGCRASRLPIFTARR